MDSPETSPPTVCGATPEGLAQGIALERAAFRLGRDSKEPKGTSGNPESVFASPVPLSSRHHSSSTRDIRRCVQLPVLELSYPRWFSYGKNLRHDRFTYHGVRIHSSRPRRRNTSRQSTS